MSQSTSISSAKQKVQISTVRERAFKKQDICRDSWPGKQGWAQLKVCWEFNCYVDKSNVWLQLCPSTGNVLSSMHKIILAEPQPPNYKWRNLCPSVSLGELKFSRQLLVWLTSDFAGVLLRAQENAASTVFCFLEELFLRKLQGRAAPGQVTG